MSSAVRSVVTSEYIADYCRQLRHKEETIRLDVCAFLTSIFSKSELERCSLLTTGSDARLEKMSDYCSPMEIILVATDVVEGQAWQKRILDEKNPLLAGWVELVVIAPSHVVGPYGRVIYFRDETLMPVRALEAQWLLGSKDIFSSYRETAYSQLTTLEPAPYREFCKKFLGDAIRQLVLAQRDESTHCRLLEGVLLINNKRVKGTKYSHLRCMQYSLDAIIIEQFKAGAWGLEQWRQMPLPIYDRISWVHAQGLMPWIADDKLTEIQHAYQTAMIWHQLAQKALEDDRTAHAEATLESCVDVAVNTEQLLSITECIARYVQGFCERFPHHASMLSFSITGGGLDVGGGTGAIK